MRHDHESESGCTPGREGVTRRGVLAGALALIAGVLMGLKLGQRSRINNYPVQVLGIAPDGCCAVIERRGPHARVLEVHTDMVGAYVAVQGRLKVSQGAFGSSAFVIETGELIPCWDGRVPCFTWHPTKRARIDSNLVQARWRSTGELMQA